jgi:kynurenine formamidase
MPGWSSDTTNSSAAVRRNIPPTPEHGSLRHSILANPCEQNRSIGLPNCILIVEWLAQLEKLPLRSFLIAAPLPIQNGSGSPLRPIAYF